MYFYYNSATNYGGALRTYSNRFLINNSKFINNSAGNYGGAIYNHADNLNITNSDFPQNKTNYGEGIYHSSGYLIVSSNIMSSKIVNELGNEIYNSGTIGILNLKYLNNSNIIVNNNTQITLKATLIDDMGNYTGQTVKFLVDALTVGYTTFIEGFANLTYFMNLNTQNTFVNGVYSGSGNNINILSGMLRIISISEVLGNINLDSDEYFVNDTAKGVINLVNNGLNTIYNIIVKIMLPNEFNINETDIQISQGSYDHITSI